MLYTLIKHRQIKKIEIHYDATLGKCNGLGTPLCFALTAYDLTQQNSLMKNKYRKRQSLWKRFNE